MAERRRLGVLQVGLVGHPGAAVLAAAVAAIVVGELGGGLDQVDELVAQVQPQRDPHRLPARPAGVQPAGVVADLADEVALAAVVRLAVAPGRTGTRRPACPIGLQQQREQPPGRLVGITPRARRSSTCARSARLRPACSSGASAFSSCEAGLDQLGRRARPAAGPAGARRSARLLPGSARPPQPAGDRVEQAAGVPEHRGPAAGDRGQRRPGPWPCRPGRAPVPRVAQRGRRPRPRRPARAAP